MREIDHWAGQMVESGLLLSARRLIERCAAAGSGNAAPVRIDAAGIPTAGREDRLRHDFKFRAQRPRIWAQPGDHCLRQQSGG